MICGCGFGLIAACFFVLMLIVVVFYLLWLMCCLLDDWFVDWLSGLLVQFRFAVARLLFRFLLLVVVDWHCWWVVNSVVVVVY